MIENGRVWEGPEVHPANNHEIFNPFSRLTLPNKEFIFIAYFGEYYGDFVIIISLSTYYEGLSV